MQMDEMGSQIADQPLVIPFPNGDFEDGEAGWTIAKDRGDVGITTAHVASGKYALRIITDKACNGAKIEGPMVPCQGPGIIELRGKYSAFSGRQLGLWIREYDADGALLPCSQENWGELGGSDGLWHDLIRQVALNERTAALQLFFLAYPKDDETIEVYIDGFSFVRLPMRIPPWPSQYKIRPDEREKLTPADIVGPDGLVYPNWTQVGVQGGIPDVPVVMNLTEMGARPETDISWLLEQCCRIVGSKGGGAILIGEGIYYLDKPVTLRDNRVVIRGSGRDKTKLIFRYSQVHPNAQMPSGWPEAAVFLFHGIMEEPERPLAADGKRGDTVLVLQDIGDLQVGDKFVLRAPDTQRWQDLLGDRSTQVWGRRVNMYDVRAIDGNAITIGQPLRIDFPVIDGSDIRRLRTIEGCGVEDMTIEHACRLPFHTVNSHWAWNCWARRLTVIDCGRSGVHFHSAKWCEVRDCDFTGFDAAIHTPHVNWWGYAGFTQSADCLMENTVWHRFRHGPQVQFGAQGNVIRNSVFNGSDMQWHAGWSTENLFENCVIDARGNYGSYGHGAYATGSSDTTHGPNGPRNVVYNCDFIARKQGVLLCGVNENWLFLHNRFVIESGEGFVARQGAFDHIIRNNVFMLSDADAPMLHLVTEDCVGIELTDNTLVGGNGNIVEGKPALAVETGNRALPASTGVPARPIADPPSIYEWQNNVRE